MRTLRAVELRFFVARHCGVDWLSRSMALASKPDLESQRIQEVLRAEAIDTMRELRLIS